MGKRQGIVHVYGHGKFETKICLKWIILGGTFTIEGTFDSIIPSLDELQDPGVNTIVIMPVAQFPGERNWGYDGVYLFGVQNSYGSIRITFMCSAFSPSTRLMQSL